jgi:hypothetical protein
MTLPSSLTRARSPSPLWRASRTLLPNNTPERKRASNVDVSTYSRGTRGSGRGPGRAACRAGACRRDQHGNGLCSLIRDGAHDLAITGAGAVGGITGTVGATGVGGALGAQDIGGTVHNFVGDNPLGDLATDATSAVATQSASTGGLTAGGGNATLMSGVRAVDDLGMTAAAFFGC